VHHHQECSTGKDVQVTPHPYSVNRGQADRRRFSETVVGAAKKGWIKPPPEVVRSDILAVSLHKQKHRPMPFTFKFKALDEGNSGKEPICNWNSRQRQWLVDCLNTIFDNCVVRNFLVLFFGMSTAVAVEHHLFMPMRRHRRFLRHRVLTVVENKA
jgi:hypothetical protein